MTRHRLDPKIRGKLILMAGLRAARRSGWGSLTREKIAREAGCSDALVSAYLGSMLKARRRIMRAAIEFKYLDLIAQGIVHGDPLCARISPILKHEALSSLK